MHDETAMLTHRTGGQVCPGAHAVVPQPPLTTTQSKPLAQSEFCAQLLTSAWAGETERRAVPNEPTATKDESHDVRMSEDLQEPGLLARAGFVHGVCQASRALNRQLDGGNSRRLRHSVPQARRADQGPRRDFTSP